jgi:dTDP-glucose pyrophosphorylase
MDRPTIVVMAAGLGSRYGGLKQIDPVDEYGNMILDYSLYDARLAGFERVIFIIQREMENDFRSVMDKRFDGRLMVDYAYQRLEDIPAGFNIPDGRVKPWGTAHAVMSARERINGPFCVINADDMYGRDAYVSMYRFLAGKRKLNDYAMVGYRIENTLTDNGFVSRGICEVNKEGYLTHVVERVHIEKTEGGAVYSEEGQQGFIPRGTIVSMNIWGFGPEIMEKLKSGFRRFLTCDMPCNPLKCEYFLPSVTNRLIASGAATVKALTTDETWYGVTYHEDKQMLTAAIRSLKRRGIYPEKLWEDDK